MMEVLHHCMAKAALRRYNSLQDFNEARATALNLALNTYVECVHTIAVACVIDGDRSDIVATEDLCRVPLPVHPTSFVGLSAKPLKLSAQELIVYNNLASLSNPAADDADGSPTSRDWPFYSAAQGRDSAIWNTAPKVWVIPIDREAHDMSSFYSVVSPGTILLPLRPFRVCTPSHCFQLVFHRISIVLI
jgi:hypothetical protein